MPDLEHLEFMNLHLVSFPRHCRPCGHENFDFREPDARGMTRMKHTLDECNLQNWELYELRKYGLKNLNEFVSLIVPLYTMKEVANMSADYLYRDIMSVIPRASHHKEEVADFLMQDCFQIDDAAFKVSRDKAKLAAMKQWTDNHHSVQPDAMDAVFECTRNAFVAYGPDAMPDVVLTRYAVTTAHIIMVEIRKYA